MNKEKAKQLSYAMEYSVHMMEYFKSVVDDLNKFQRLIQLQNQLWDIMRELEDFPNSLISVNPEECIWKPLERAILEAIQIVKH